MCDSPAGRTTPSPSFTSRHELSGRMTAAGQAQNRTSMATSGGNNPIMVVDGAAIDNERDNNRASLVTHYETSV